jgi:thiol-disulfide isomerase/thioredoxin
MKKLKNQKGSALLYTIIAIIVIGAGLIAYASFSNNQTADNSDQMMEDDGNAMMEDSSDDAMMEDDSDAMMEDSKDDSMMEDDSDAMMEDDDSAKADFMGAVLAGSASPLLDFNQEDYNKALNTNKLVALYFYANWCPVCKRETSSALYPAFNELTDDDVIGFRINYNDNQTDNNEEELAREFGVAYQHTKVFVKNGERVLKSPESWDKDRYLEELAKYE